MSVLDLARPELRAMAPYSSARMEAGGGDDLAQRQRIAVESARERARAIATPIRSRLRCWPRLPTSTR